MLQLDLQFVINLSRSQRGKLRHCWAVFWINLHERPSEMLKQRLTWVCLSSAPRTSLPDKAAGEEKEDPSQESDPRAELGKSVESGEGGAIGVIESEAVGEAESKAFAENGLGSSSNQEDSVNDTGSEEAPPGGEQQDSRNRVVLAEDFGAAESRTALDRHEDDAVEVVSGGDTSGDTSGDTLCVVTDVLGGATDALCGAMDTTDGATDTPGGAIDTPSGASGTLSSASNTPSSTSDTAVSNDKVVNPEHNTKFSEATGDSLN